VCAAQHRDASEFAVGRAYTAHQCNSAHLRVYRSHVRCIERPGKALLAFARATTSCIVIGSCCATLHRLSSYFRFACCRSKNVVKN